MQIWGRLSSINVRKVVWAAQETGAPFSRTDAGAAFGIVSTAQYRQLNPNALVPTLQDGDLTLWESNVIVRYLATKYPAAALLPADLGLRFVAEQWCADRAVCRGHRTSARKNQPAPGRAAPHGR